MRSELAARHTSCILVSARSCLPHFSWAAFAVVVHLWPRRACRRSNWRAPPAAVRLDPPGLHIEHDAFLQHSKHSTATMVAGISKALAQSASCASCRCCARQLARVWAQRGRSPSARPNRAGQYRTRRRICFLPKPYGLWVVCCSLSISHLACVLSLALALAAGAGVRRGQTRHDQGG